MTELSAETAEQADLRVSHTGPIEAPPLVPGEPAIDRAHLALMTGGDRALEREVLQLFVMQAGLLLGRMQGATPAEIGAFAHTLCGSARGIGAWRVAEAAEVLERKAAAAGEGISMARERLATAVGETTAAIAQMAAAAD